MNIAKRNMWKEALDKRAEEERRKKQEEEHPLAAMKNNKTPENVLAEEMRDMEHTLSGDTGKGGDKKEDAFTIPSDTKTEAEETRKKMDAEASELLDAGQEERERANAASEALYQAILAFSEKQDGRYDELYSLVKEDDYRRNAAAKEILYEYLQNGEIAADDTAARLAAENGGYTDSYSLAMAGREKDEYAGRGEEAARSYYSDYLDRILRVLQASGGDMNDLYANMQDNVDTAQKAANTDLTLGKELLESLADAQTAERRVEETGFVEMLDAGNKTQTQEISPMRVDAEYQAMIAGGENGQKHTETEALMILWDKYPSMRTYILEKYINEVKDPYNLG